MLAAHGAVCIAREVAMTAKKDLKRRIRERAKKTGESYTAARAQVTKLRIENAPSATVEARAEGFHCEAAVSKNLRALGDLRPLFARLRQLLEALDAELCGPLLRGETATPRVPSFASALGDAKFVWGPKLGLRGQVAKLAWNGHVVVVHFSLLRKPLMTLGLLEDAQRSSPLLGLGR
jgi:hypothetical protein